MALGAIQRLKQTQYASVLQKYVYISITYHISLLSICYIFLIFCILKIPFAFSTKNIKIIFERNVNKM